MKRTSGLYQKLCTFAHLLQASHEAARGKRRRTPVNRFLLDQELEVLQLQSMHLPGSMYLRMYAACMSMAKPLSRLVAMPGEEK